MVSIPGDSVLPGTAGTAMDDVIAAASAESAAPGVPPLHGHHEFSLHSHQQHVRHAHVSLISVHH